MKYLCLVYLNEEEWDAQSESEYSALVSDILAYREFLRRSGQLLDARSLQRSHTATTVRVREGGLVVTDGPFAETKKHLGGYMLIEARDLNEAIRIAANMPAAHRGSIEVRPLKELHAASPDQLPVE